mmetsp:Transcript_6409/g.9253  ORF Transcript_6409/g.9253 Transcript_6409/m.9253 type:complete len:274 (-) Transcript_6409:91-912(-)
MATSLIKAISSARAVDELRKQLDLVDLCGEMSNVFLTLKSIVPEISDDEARSEPMHQPQESITLPPKESFEDVTALVSAVGSAPEGHERTKAIDALKRFLEQHGNSELNAHLEEISPTFRAYIVEQLGSAPSSVTTNSPSTNSKLALPMSERIKKLRSKINVLDPGSTETNNDPAQPTISYANTSTGSGHHSPLKISRTSGLPQASPSQIASVSSLRQRLAAAQENRSSKTSIEIDNPPKQSVIAAPSASTSGNAAALRARLQAMKNQNKQLS